MSDENSHQDPFRFDEEDFQQRIPFKLVRTNLPGAYTAPPPPTDDYDPNTVRPGDLIRHGMTVRRPDAKTEPLMRAAWDHVFGRKWLARDRVVPHLSPQPGKTHNMRQKPIKQSNGEYTGNNWSGAALGGLYPGTTPWSTVIATWKIPTVSKPSESPGTKDAGWDSSSWVGLDGYADYSLDVLQVGVEQSGDWRRTPTRNVWTPKYVAWVEWFVPPPDPASLPPGTAFGTDGYPVAWTGPGGLYQYIHQSNIDGLTVSAGDEVCCSAQYASDNAAATLQFANITTGQHTTIALAPPPNASFAGNSAEWIMEAPDNGEPYSSLPRFTPVQFTWAFACRANGEYPGAPGSANAETLNIALNPNTPQQKLLTSVVNDSVNSTITFIG